jgi:hypothetical protein
VAVVAMVVDAPVVLVAEMMVRQAAGVVLVRTRVPPEREVLDWTAKCNLCHVRGHKEDKCPSVTRAMQQ